MKFVRLYKDELGKEYYKEDKYTRISNLKEYVQKARDNYLTLTTKVLLNSDEIVEFAETMIKLQKNLDNEIKSNFNLRRMAKERANKDRGLDRIKGNLGFVTTNFSTFSFKVDNMNYIDCYKTRFESPIQKDIEYDVALYEMNSMIPELQRVCELGEIYKTELFFANNSNYYQLNLVHQNHGKPINLKLKQE